MKKLFLIVSLLGAANLSANEKLPSELKLEEIEEQCKNDCKKEYPGDDQVISRLTKEYGKPQWCECGKVTEKGFEKLK